MGKTQKLKEAMRAMLSFSQKERRGILLFIPLIVVASLLLMWALRPRFIPELQLAADMQNVPTAEYGEVERGEAILFRFDPNTVTYKELRLLGFDQKTASGIIKYRTAGKVFRIREDFASCRDISDSAYFALEPYIVIGAQYALSGRRSEAPAYAARPEKPARPDSLFVFDPNTLPEEGFVLLGFSPRQASAIIARREQIKGFRTPAEFSECYVVSAEQFARLEPFLKITPVEKKVPAKVGINTADSVELLTVAGIGPLTAGRIIALRRALGGFDRAEQLVEVKGMTEQNYERILQQIFVDRSVITKIDINFAPPGEISSHPYISPEMLRKIVKNRQLKGGWSTTEDMVKDATLTEAQALRLRPYLVFTTR